MPVRNGNRVNDRTTTTKAASVRKQLDTKDSKSREDTIVQMTLTERLVRSRSQWAGDIETMADDRLSKSAAELREEGRRRRETRDEGAKAEMGRLC